MSVSTTFGMERGGRGRWRPALVAAMMVFGLVLAAAGTAWAQTHAGEVVHQAGGEANLVLPDLNQGSFLGMTGRALLMTGIVVCLLGLLFGIVIYTQLRKMPVHAAMLEISEKR